MEYPTREEMIITLQIKLPKYSNRYIENLDDHELTKLFDEKVMNQ